MKISHSVPLRCVVAGLLLMCVFNIQAQEDGPTAKDGILDLSNYDFDGGAVALTGRWNFFDGKLLTESECRTSPPNLVDFPQVWNKLRADGNGQGYGTYYLRIILPESLQNPGLSLPQMYCSYELWVDGTSIAQNGSVGTSRNTYSPQWLPQVATFSHIDDTVHLVLQIANYDHNLGGTKETILLGKRTELVSYNQTAKTGTLIEIGILALLFITCMVIQIIQKEKKRILFYFGLVCLSWAVRAGFSNIYVVTSYFPDFNWALAVRIEYITLFFTMIWGILFIGRLFQNEENKIIKYLLVSGNSFFIAFAVLTGPLTFSKGMDIYLTFCAILLVYGVYIVIRALINERVGGWYLAASSLLAITIFALDVSAYKGIIANRPVLFSVGYILMYVLMMIALMLHLKIFKSSSVSNMLTYDDLYKDQGN